MKDYAAVARQYADDVIAGKIVACKWLRLACERYVQDMERAESDEACPWTFSEWHANDVCDFAEKMPHVEGVWDTKTIVLEPPQVFMLAAIFGYRRRVDGLRRFTSVYIEMARKGAKSTLTAVVTLYCLTCENEPGAQIIIGATTGEQAKKVFSPAKAMADKLPAFREAKGVTTWARSITSDSGYIQTINARGKTQDGWNPYVGVLDELHAHPNRALFDVIASAFGSRRSPLLWVITTAGYDTTGVCYERRQYLTKVLERTIESDHMFGVIYTIDEGDDPFDPAVWSKANPMLGVTPLLSSMQTYAIDAQASPASEGEFKTKRLNVWMNASSAWLNSVQWMACADTSLGWDAFEGLDCYIGGDLADKDDITALVLAAHDGDRLISKSVFWLPEAVLKQPDHAEGRAAAPYATWVKQGHLHLTPGDWVDHNEVEAQVRAWCSRYAVRRATFDQFAAAQGMASRLNEDLGTPDDPLAVVLHKKASAVTDPAKDLEARVKSGPLRFVHDGNPVMNWMASNVTVARRRDETLLPVKESPMSANKIDGIDALINAIHPCCTPSDDDGDTEIATDYQVIML